MKVLVTGVTGFVGSHMVEFLLEQEGVEIAGLTRWRSPKGLIEGFKDKIKLYDCDLCDAASVRDVIADFKPDRIFHLAAQSFVPPSWKAPTATFEANVMGQLHFV